MVVYSTFNCLVVLLCCLLVTAITFYDITSHLNFRGQNFLSFYVCALASLDNKNNNKNYFSFKFKIKIWCTSDKSFLIGFIDLLRNLDTNYH